MIPQAEFVSKAPEKGLCNFIIIIILFWYSQQTTFSSSLSSWPLVVETCLSLDMATVLPWLD